MRAAALLVGAAAVTAQPSPPNLTEWECGVHLRALKWSAARYRQQWLGSVSDALGLERCPPDVRREAEAIRRNGGVQRPPSVRGGGGVQVYVATDGSDSTGDGSEKAPFATLQRARDSVRQAGKGGGEVIVRAGKYYLNETLLLTQADNGLTIRPYDGEHVTLSGGRSIRGLDWSCADEDCKVLKAGVVLPKAPPAPHHSLFHDYGPAPEVVNQLFVDGERQVRARYPNGNPQHNDGKCFQKQQHPDERCDWLMPTKMTGLMPIGPYQKVKFDALDRGLSPTKGCKECLRYGLFEQSIYAFPEGHPVYNKPMPGLGWNNNSMFSYWEPLFLRFSKVEGAPLPRQWARPETGVMHMLHGKLWGGWMFRIAKRDNGTLHLGYGGYQEARGSRYFNKFYVENIREELDAPQEWFYDDKEDVLYLYPNGTAKTPAALSKADVVAPILDSLIRVQGAPGAPAKGITVEGMEFTETRATFLDQYEMPSGGDWTLHRNAALLVQDAENVTVSNCVFNQTGGNGVLFSNHVEGSSVLDSEFVQTGDSAVVFVGRTNGVDGTAPTYPNKNTVARNHMHEYGVYGKQTSCFFQSISANTTLAENVCYNGPRAGVNFNDGFGGGNLMTKNLLFNHVRETGDHGPFNSWDRQPYLTRSGVDDGFPDFLKMGLKGASIIKAQCHITKNFIINGYNGVWTIDHDDGSQFYNDTSNFMVWGGCKNYLGHSKSCDHNMIVYPGIPERSSGSRRCQTDDNGVFANQYFHNNTCVTGDGVQYTFAKCNPELLDVPNGTVYQTAFNDHLTAAGTFSQTCNGDYNLQKWQDLRQDLGSTVSVMPPLSDILDMGMKKLE
eukprot:TRINITY_DN10870_c0_g4_i4.p1 TRINITY_DN10870_c0_g4~~TRINITY_DN10870_c0_g4_i4.p1  ORF type:complete len:838 (+),score=319.04 TRINITY_DN10870_c0_g4_i4:49-2562(+)